MKIAVLISRYYKSIAEGMLAGVIETLREREIDFDQKRDIFDAPGAFEMPLLAGKIAEKYDGVICLGCVIKGETAHFEYISANAAQGIMQESLRVQKPIAFGILTVYTEEQAIERSKPGPHNKGREAALACIQSLACARSLI